MQNADKNAFFFFFNLIEIQIITLSDVECDHLNAQDCYQRLNFVSIYLAA